MLVNLFSSKYENLAFQGSPALIDMRPYQWSNYDKPGPHADIELRYTSYLDIAPRSDAQLEDWPVHKSFSPSRRRCIRSARAAGVTTIRDDNAIGPFLDLYTQTFDRQSIKVEDAERELLAAEGVLQVDFEGINSPKRGYFKLSFGGDIRPYFRINIGK